MKCGLFFLSVCSVYVATHLPDDEEDEGGAQHQGEHVAEGRKGERHGRSSQPDDGRVEREEGELSSPLSASLVANALLLSPSVGGYRLCSAPQRKPTRCRPGR